MVFHKWIKLGIVLVLALSLLLVFTACSSQAGDQADLNDPFPAEPLTVLEWSGYEATEYPYFFPSFTEKYTPTVEKAVDYIFFAEDPEALAKVQSGVEVDLIHPCELLVGPVCGQRPGATD